MAPRWNSPSLPSVVATHAVLLARIVQRLRGEVRAFQRQIDALNGLTA